MSGASIIFPLLGVIAALLMFYELVSGRAYATKLRGSHVRAYERWHFRAEDPSTYWRLVMQHALFGGILIGGYVAKLNGVF